ncbi:hypothetical protein DFJ73DRAFT_800500 [Zopfochytrium polystomum]|nr:hypothetical protein DFJ73DRAFT_800500 [Zopfochytrium polystomum]
MAFRTMFKMDSSRSQSSMTPTALWKQINAIAAAAAAAAAAGDDDAAAEIDHDAMAASASKILAANPSDPDALHVLVVALIHLDRVPDALAALAAAPASDHLAFERAYCLYKALRLDECLDVVQAAKKKAGQRPSRALLEIEMQLLYRMDRYDESAAVGRELVARIDENNPYFSEVLSNLLAAQFGSVLAHPEAAAAIGDAAPPAGDTYEAAYNAASQAAVVGRWADASRLLGLAKKRLNDLTTDGLMTPAEKKEELSIIDAQQAFVFQKQGRVDEAKALYQSALNANPETLWLKNVIQNNLLCAESPADLFHTGKRFKAMSSDTLDPKMLLPQKKAIELNRGLLLGYLKKIPAARTLVGKTMAEYPDDDGTAALVHASLFALDKKHSDQVVGELESACAQRPSSNALHLALSQVHLQRNNVRGAIDALSSLVANSAPPLPGPVSLLVWLARAAGERALASDVLDKAAAAWASDPMFSKNHALLHATATTKLALSRPQDAARDFEKLFDLALAERYAAKLEPVATLMAAADRGEGMSVDVDVDAIERNPAAAVGGGGSGGGGGVDGGVNSGDGQAQTKERKKRKRKIRLPKNYDPNATPYPERWVPKRERAAYKKRQAKSQSKLDALRGPQGGSVAASTGALGGTGSARIAGFKAPPQSPPVAAAAPPQPEEPAASGGGGGGGASKGKKKKGRK